MSDPEPIFTPEDTIRALHEELDRIRHGEDRLQLLADVTNILIDDVLDYESRLRNLSRIIVPRFADWCAIDIVIPGRETYIVMTLDDEKQSLAEEIRHKYPPRPDSNYGVAEVIRTRQPTIYPEMPDELVRRTTQSEEHYQLLKALGTTSVMVVPMISHSRVLGGITFVISESPHRYNESDLEIAMQLGHRAAVALDNALAHEEIIEANRAKEKFLAMLAHELRNPLTPIRNSLPILAARGGDDAELREITELMERQIHTMSRLLDDLLDVSRITEGKIQFHMEELELLAVMKHVLAIMQPEIRRKGHEFSAALTEEPMYIRGDRVRLEQIVVNLLNNATKYTPRGGKISLECVREGNQAVIRVRDSGKGIPPHMLKRIFQLFVQVDQALDRSEGGLGLGLTIVQMLVQHHGGTVSAKSEGPDKGSEFEVRLPLLPAAPAGVAAAPAATAAGDPPKRILVVDDNEDAANSIGKLLRKIGHDVRIAYDGRSALETAAEFKPEAILLDLGLPVMDGYEAARRLRTDMPSGKLLLVALSGYGQEEDRRKTQAAGFDYHLVKPFDTRELRDILNSWTPAV